MSLTKVMKNLVLQNKIRKFTFEFSKELPEIKRCNIQNLFTFISDIALKMQDDDMNSIKGTCV